MLKAGFLYHLNRKTFPVTETYAFRTGKHEVKIFREFSELKSLVSSIRDTKLKFHNHYELHNSSSSYWFVLVIGEELLPMPFNINTIDPSERLLESSESDKLTLYFIDSNTGILCNIFEVDLPPMFSLEVKKFVRLQYKTPSYSFNLPIPKLNYKREASLYAFSSPASECDEV